MPALQRKRPGNKHNKRPIMRNRISPKHRSKQAIAWFSALSADDRLCCPRRCQGLPETRPVQEPHWLPTAIFLFSNGAESMQMKQRTIVMPIHNRPQPPRLDRIRSIRGSFSWIDHRFLREGFDQGLTRLEKLFYFVLIAVSNQDGVSFYSDERLAEFLDIRHAHELTGARNEL